MEARAFSPARSMVCFNANRVVAHRPCYDKWEKALLILHLYSEAGAMHFFSIRDYWVTHCTSATMSYLILLYRMTTEIDKCVNKSRFTANLAEFSYSM